MITDNLRKRFIKDFDIPISFFDEDRYLYFKNLYDSFFNISAKEQLFNEVITHVSNHEHNPQLTTDAYFQYSQDVSSKLKNIISTSDAFRKMNDFELVNNKLSNNIRKQQIYIEPNIDKKLFSVNLNKANFNCFNLFGLFDELKINNYADFIQLATPFEYFQESRMTRQIIFGELNPVRQQAIQKSIIIHFSELLLKEGLQLTSASSDEIIIDPQNNPDVNHQFILDILKDVNPLFKFFRVEAFSFSKIHPSKDYFFKRSIDENGKYKESFKNVPSTYFAQTFKYHYHLPLEDNDLLFQTDGQLAKFIYPHFSLDNPKPKRKF